MPSFWGTARKVSPGTHEGTFFVSMSLFWLGISMIILEYKHNSTHQKKAPRRF